MKTNAKFRPTRKSNEELTAEFGAYRLEAVDGTMVPCQAEIRHLLNTDTGWIYRALQFLLEQQTTAEIQSKTTNEYNGRGFSIIDARFGTSLAQSYNASGRLSETQLYYAGKMLPRYWKQIRDEIIRKHGGLKTEKKGASRG